MAAAVPDEELWRWHLELARLTRSEGRRRLAAGAAADKLCSKGLHRTELGFSSLDAFAKERRGVTGRTLSEWMTVARRARELPELLAAMLGDAVGWSMSELIARHATPETETDLLAQARGRSIRQLRAQLRAAAEDAKEGASGESGEEASEDANADASEQADGDASEGAHGEASAELGDDEEEEERFVTLGRRARREDLALFEGTRHAVEHLEGSAARGWRWIEILLAEYKLTLIERGPHVDVVQEGLEREHEQWLARCAAFEHRRRWLEAQAEPSILRQRAWGERALAEMDLPPDGAEDPYDLPGDPYLLEQRLRQLCADAASPQLAIGKLAKKVLRAKGPERLGYASERQYAEEHLFGRWGGRANGAAGDPAGAGLGKSVSRSWLRSCIQLAERTKDLDAITVALGDGKLGFATAQLLARVSTPETERAWVARADERTYKQLEEEVEAVEMMARVMGDRRVLVPPTPEELEEIRRFERQILTGELIRQAVDKSRGARAHGCEDGGIETSAGDGDEGVEDPENLDLLDLVQTSACRTGPDGADPSTDWLGLGELRHRVPEDIALEWRKLERAHAQAKMPGGFVQQMCLSFFETWSPWFTTKMKWGDVYARDLYRCASPTCFRRDATPQHMKFRSAGGGDEAEAIVEALRAQRTSVRGAARVQQCRRGDRREPQST